MNQTLKIDIVSDVVCPWCIIGWQSLSAALDELKDDIRADITWQPFELNPDMPAEGQDIAEHLMWKYGMTRAQADNGRDMIRQRGADVGFTFNMEDRSRIWNTFDAHRLLHWAGEQSPERQTALKLALFKAYFSDGKNPSDVDVLVDAAMSVGLDGDRAREIVAGDAYADITRQQESFWQQNGVNSVPTFIINNKHAITGGQPSEVFVRALRHIAGDAETSAA